MDKHNLPDISLVLSIVVLALNLVILAIKIAITY